MSTQPPVVAIDPAGNGQDGAEESQRTSWWPVDLTSGAELSRIEPTMLSRVDGVKLFYRGRLHALIGESEACKTWMTYLAVLELVNVGRHVLVVDFEDAEHTCMERLVALGLTRDAIAEHVHFLHPAEPLSDRQGRITAAQADLAEVLATWPIELGIFDGITEGMGIEGLNPLDNADVAAWYRAVPRRVTAVGAAVVMLDHVTKDREGRGRYALGGVHKLNGLDGAGYILEAIDSFAPGRTGRIKVTVNKDRPGQVRRHAIGRGHIAQLVLTSTDDGTTVTGRLTAPEEHSSGEFMPTVLMEKVSRHVELYPGANKSDLRSLGNSEYVDQAIARLVEHGHLRIERGPRNAHLHHSVTPYRDAPEDPTDADF